MWFYSNIESSKEGSQINYEVCLKTGPQTLHRVRTSASSIYILLRSSSSCLCLLPCLLVTSSLFLSHHPVGAYIYFLAFPSLLLYSFPHHPVGAYVFFFPFRHFYPTPLTSSSSCLRLLPCLFFTSSLPLSYHPVGAYIFFLVFPSFLPYPFPIIQ